MPEFLEDKLLDDLMPYVRAINIVRLQEDPQLQIWNLPYFSTTDEEDNDTDSEEEDTVTKNEHYTAIKLKENLLMEKFYIENKNNL